MSKFTRWWSVKQTYPQHVDVIALVSFGATPYRITDGLSEVIKIGKHQKQKYPNAKVVFGEFTGNETPGLERDYKLNIFVEAYYAETVFSTVEESINWKHVLRYVINLHSLVIATDEMHSRSARRVSNRVFNGVWFVRLFKWLTKRSMIQIHVVTFPTALAIDPESPMTALRDQKKWIIGNVARELFLMFCPFGYTIMRLLKLHQPTVKK